jgi:hypothetical protein
MMMFSGTHLFKDRAVRLSSWACIIDWVWIFRTIVILIRDLIAICIDTLGCVELGMLTAQGLVTAIRRAGIPIVTVECSTQPTGISLPIAVAIFLIRVGNCRTVVTDITHAVAVLVGLP